MRKQSRTCIAAVKLRNGKIAMAADRRVSWDYSQAQVMPRAKINKRDGVILSGTGDGYLCGLIVDILAIPDYNFEETDRLSTDLYMHNQFFNSVQALLKSKNLRDEHGIFKVPGEMYAEILVAINGFLYNIIIENPEPYSESTSGLIAIDELSLPYATGCGGPLAWGSLLTLKDLSKGSLKEHLYIALKVAASVSPGCDDNIDIEVE